MKEAEGRMTDNIRRIERRLELTWTP